MNSERFFADDDFDFLLSLMRTNTVTPMESGHPGELVRAMDMYADAARDVGLERLFYAHPPQEILNDPSCPRQVLEVYALMGDEFLRSQPSQVLSIGSAQVRERTLMFNVHLDTVSEYLPVSHENGNVFGRGAVDMKGPAVALLAGIGRALASNPLIIDDMRILLQCVAGEEGGAMGVYGSKWLAEMGFTGGLNIFCEPSDGVFFDKSTTSMTLRCDVQGQGATDDAPASAHNASLLLGYIAQYFAEHLAPLIFDGGGKLTLGGVTTGATHNRVFGSGSLYFNFAYGSTQFGEDILHLVQTCIQDCLQDFSRTFKGNPIGAKTVADLDNILDVQWLKKGMPVLNNRDPEMEELLYGAGLIRSGDEQASQAFTCDAMWVQGQGGYTIVFGPGGLESNGAHTNEEFITRQSLENYAKDIFSIINAFHHRINQIS